MEVAGRRASQEAMKRFEQFDIMAELPGTRNCREP
jgi:hypothetical protein